jgi:hypothetical protein
MLGKDCWTAINHQARYNMFASGKRCTKSCNAFMIHSPPLCKGASWITPTSVSSVQTCITGHCQATQAASSFSCCSGTMVASAVLFDSTSTLASAVMRAGVKLVGKHQWRAEMTCGTHICVSRVGSCLCVIQVMHLHSAPHIPFKFVFLWVPLLWSFNILL